MHLKRPKDFGSKRKKLAFCPLPIFLKKCCRFFLSLLIALKKEVYAFMQCFKDIETRKKNPVKAIPFKGLFCMILFYSDIAFRFLVIVKGLTRLLTLGILISTQFAIVINLH